MYSMHIYYIYIYDTCLHRCTYLNCHIFIIRMSVCCIITVTIKYVYIYIYIILFIKSISKYTTWAISLSKQNFALLAARVVAHVAGLSNWTHTVGQNKLMHSTSPFALQVMQWFTFERFLPPRQVPAQHVALHAFFAFFCLPWAEKYTTSKRGSDRVQALNQFNPAVHICPFIDVKSIAGYKYYQITNVIKSNVRSIV